MVKWLRSVTVIFSRANPDRYWMTIGCIEFSHGFEIEVGVLSFDLGTWRRSSLIWQG